jgi:hypothetical protein
LEDFLFDRARVMRPAGKRPHCHHPGRLGHKSGAHMSAAIKLLFGLRTSEVITVTVTGSPGPQAPDLQITTRGLPNDAVVSYASGAWTATISPGDHVVRMEVPGELWFAGGVHFALSAPATIVGYGDASSPRPTAWVSAAGAIDDPKDPLPPPLAASAVALADQDWLNQTLQALVPTDLKSAPPLRTLQHKTAR